MTAALDTLDLDASHLGDGGTITPQSDPGRERAGLRIALAINAAFFVAELTFGILSRSMGLIADGLDMGADASVYALSLAAVGATTTRKNRLARTSGYLQLGLAIIGLIEVVRRAVIDSEPPDTATMITIASLALAGNIATIVVLHRIKTDEAHLQASWILTANEDLIIEGEIEGTIAHQDKNLTVGKEGRVKADIAAKTVEIYGKVEGNIHGDDLVKLAKSSDVRGNIRCQRIIMDDGAHFDGSIEMERKTARNSSDPTQLPVSEAPEKAKSAG